VGTGCSAVQTLRTTAEKAAQTYVFQRTPNWLVENPLYYKKVPKWMDFAFRHIPLAQRAYRRKQWLQSEWNYLNIAKDKEYPAALYWLGERLFPMKLHHAEMQKDMEAYIKQKCGDDEQGRILAEKCTPDYPALCKRVVIDNQWIETLRRDDVALITEPIARLEAGGIVAAAGGAEQAYAVDVVIFATGFKSNDFLVPMEILGTAGKTLKETWGREPRAYLGVVAPPAFPNLYFFYGPNTNSGHHSIIAHAECEVAYVLGCCKAMRRNCLWSIAVKPEVFDQCTNLRGLRGAHGPGPPWARSAHVSL
jgi:4-hydroxyacetophenone monooxygenase